MPTFPRAEFTALWCTLERLLAPDGCPWDREQQAADVARHCIEEAHEWLEACRGADPASQADELGDLAYLVLFGLLVQARDLGAQPGQSLRLIDAKLRRRHPHLFGGEAAAPKDSREQLGVWEQVKREERRAQGGDEAYLKPLPASLGALARSHRYQEKAAQVGFDWPDLAGVLAKLAEERAELEREMVDLPLIPPSGKGQPSERYRGRLAGKDLGRLRDELGDLFFVLANLCRWLGMDAEEVAEDANRKFLRRFNAMEASLRARGRSLQEADLDEMESHWQAIKRDDSA